ncbi:hypothetical protein [Pseudarthrobacter sp. NPDC080039]|uniref:hypothetical protein n=1 Tax=unclassified Pseudarthrobacter TaxID=2647000 RepID=UPI0034510C4D
MNVHPYPSKAAVATAAAALLVCTSVPAQAATTATAASVSQSVGSGSWGAVATLSTAAPYTTGALKITFTNQGTPGQPSFSPQFFTIGNTGTLPINRAAYTATAVAPSTVQFIVESCNTTWNESTGVCTNGTTAQLLATPAGSSTSSMTSTTVPSTPGANLRLRARVASTGNVPNNSPTTLTVDLAVDRTQVRTATTTG